MAKQDQVIRTVITTNEGERELLIVWRSGLDFYSALSGKSGHRAYHERGRVHTKLTKWGDKDYYVDKNTKRPTQALDSVEFLQTLVFYNNPTQKEERRRFAIYHGGKPTQVVRFNAAAENAFFTVITGVSPSANLIENAFADLKSNAKLSLIDIKHLENADGPSIFVAILKASESNVSALRAFLQNTIGTNNFAVTKSSTDYALIDGEITSVAMVIAGSGTKKRFHPLPPNLPIRIDPTLPAYEIEVGREKFSNTYIQVGSLSLRVLPTSSPATHSIFIIPTKILYRTTTIFNACCSSMIHHRSGRVIQLEFAEYGGHRECQFEMDGLNYQIEILSVWTTTIDSQIDNELMMDSKYILNLKNDYFPGRQTCKIKLYQLPTPINPTN